MEEKKLELLHTITCKEYFDQKAYEGNSIGVEFQDFTEVNLFTENWSHVTEFYLNHLQYVQGKIGMHGAFIDLKPYSYDKYISDNSMFKYRMSLNMACLLEVDYIIFHSQLNPFIHNEMLIELDNTTHSKLFMDLMEEFHNFKGILCIENVYEQDPYLLLALMEKIDHPQIKVNLDIGHAHLSKNYSLEDWIDILGNRIAYCHFQWNDGTKDTHSSPTEEEIIEILKIFEKKDLNIPLSLEYFPQDITKEISKFQRAIEKGGLKFEI
ncbi:MAG: TIM barrel protein [Tissierellia bacterium]|nr:TIM barrel protein [Tissierellia bacterium]